MPVNVYGQKTNDQGEVIYEFGPNAGKTASQVKAEATQSGGAGSSYVTNPNTGQSQVTVTPNLIPQENQAAQEQMRLKAQLQADAETRRMASISAMSSSGPTAPHVSGDGGVDNSAAQAAAFGRAKEMAGQNASAALKALEDVMGARGLHGSSIEGAETGNILTGGMRQVNDTVRDQTLQSASRAAQVNDRNYAGDITQRAQDMQAKQQLLALVNAGGVY